MLKRSEPPKKTGTNRSSVSKGSETVPGRKLFKGAGLCVFGFRDRGFRVLVFRGLECRHQLQKLRPHVQAQPPVQQTLKSATDAATSTFIAEAAAVTLLTRE